MARKSNLSKTELDTLKGLEEDFQQLWAGNIAFARPDDGKRAKEVKESRDCRYPAKRLWVG